MAQLATRHNTDADVHKKMAEHECIEFARKVCSNFSRTHNVNSSLLSPTKRTKTGSSATNHWSPVWACKLQLQEPCRGTSVGLPTSSASVGCGSRCTGRFWFPSKCCAAMPLPFWTSLCCMKVRNNDWPMKLPMPPSLPLPLWKALTVTQRVPLLLGNPAPKLFHFSLSGRTKWNRRHNKNESSLWLSRTSRAIVIAMSHGAKSLPSARSLHINSTPKRTFYISFPNIFRLPEFDKIKLNTKNDSKYPHFFAALASALVEFKGEDQEEPSQSQGPSIVVPLPNQRPPAEEMLNQHPIGALFWSLINIVSETAANFAFLFRVWAPQFPNCVPQIQFGVPWLCPSTDRAPHYQVIPWSCCSWPSVPLEQQRKRWTCRLGWADSDFGVTFSFDGPSNLHHSLVAQLQGHCQHLWGTQQDALAFIRSCCVGQTRRIWSGRRRLQCAWVWNPCLALSITQGKLNLWFNARFVTAVLYINM